jgi:hypothetical protein
MRIRSVNVENCSLQEEVGACVDLIQKLAFLSAQSADIFQKIIPDLLRIF